MERKFPARIEISDNFGVPGKVLNHFTVVCSVTWPLDGSEAGVDLWYRPRCFCCVKQAVLMLTKSIYMMDGDGYMSQKGTHAHWNSCPDIAFIAYFKWDIYGLKIISVHAFLLWFFQTRHATLIVVILDLVSLGFSFNEPSIQWVIYPLAGLTTHAGKKVR